jgi:hypothetical protein
MCLSPSTTYYFIYFFNLDYHGNPKLYATWLDEALNKVLKASCRQTSQSTFERSVLFRMRYMLRKDTWKRRIDE